MIKVFTDIETLPGKERPDPSTIKPPANYKDEKKIRAYQEENADEQYRRQALDSMAGRIICIGCAIDDEPVEVLYNEDEDVLLSDLYFLLGTELGNKPFDFVGWNVKGFDLPFIWRKAVKYNLRELRNVINRDRYRGNAIDLMLTWATDYKDFRKQSDVARFLGIGTEDIWTGGEVYDLFCLGDSEGIIEHCRADVETTRAIYRRIYE